MGKLAFVEIFEFGTSGEEHVVEATDLLDVFDNAMADHFVFKAFPPLQGRGCLRLLLQKRSRICAHCLQMGSAIPEILACSVTRAAVPDPDQVILKDSISDIVLPLLVSTSVSLMSSFLREV